MAKSLKAVPVTLVKDKDDESEAFNDAPLFEVDAERKIASVLVMRTDPDEGTLGTMPTQVTELAIKRRWGGGTFQLQARDERNRPMKGGFRTIQIAGDPIFESKAAQAKWNRQQQIEGGPPASSDAIGLKDVIALLSTTEQKASAAAALRLEEQERQHKRELERLRLEAEIKAEERKAEEQRRERALEEREERRRREDEERDERRRKDEELTRQRDREFQVMLRGLTQQQKGGGDGADMLLKGIALARDLGGGGETDPVSAVAAALLPTLLGPKLAGAAPAVAAAVPAAPAAPADESVTFDGPLGRKTLKLVEHLKGQGYDPEAAISHVWDTLLQSKRSIAAPGNVAPASAPGPSDAAPAPAAGKATAPAKRRTTKK